MTNFARTATKQPMQAAALAGLAALCLTLFVSWHGTPIPGDIRVIQEVQQADPLRGNERWVNALGTLGWQLAVVIGAVVVAALGPRFGVVAGSPAQRTQAIWTLLAALALRFLAGPLKEAAQAQRPLAEFGISVNQDFAGYGFPSGHVFGDVLVFGALAFVAPAIAGKAPGAAVRVFCIAVIVMAGPARMVVGAHWPSDVLGGYLWGAAALWLTLAAGRRLAGGR